MNIDTRIKYRHLVCFLEMARQGSLARAADVLAVSQPAMSKTLKELEELLTVSLFQTATGICHQALNVFRRVTERRQGTGTAQGCAGL